MRICNNRIYIQAARLEAISNRRYRLLRHRISWTGRAAHGKNTFEGSYEKQIKA